MLGVLGVRMWRWPGHVPAGRVDWLPTLCAITGVEINAADFDGAEKLQAWAATRPKDYEKTKAKDD